MVETADLAFVVNAQSVTADAQIVESNMCRGKHQSEDQCEPDAAIFFGVLGECSVQHAAIIP